VIVLAQDNSGYSISVNIAGRRTPLRLVGEYQLGSHKTPVPVEAPRAQQRRLIESLVADADVRQHVGHQCKFHARTRV